MLSASLVVFLCSALASATNITVDHEINTFERYPNRDSIKNMARRIGFPYASTHPQTDLFSVDQITDILKNKWVENELDKVGVRDQCFYDLLRVVTSIRQQWALSMIDADGKLPPGVMYGYFAWTGSYRECLAVEAPPDPSNHGSHFGGRYCVLAWTVQQRPLTTGVCVPDSCDESDLSNLTNFRQLLKGRHILPNITSIAGSLAGYVSLQKISCQQKDHKYDAGAISVLVIVFIFLFLVITGTSLTVFEFVFPLRSCPDPEQVESIEGSLENGSVPTIQAADSNPAEENISSSDLAPLVSVTGGRSLCNKIGAFLKCFCIITNGAKILDTSDKGGSELRCIHGIRFLSMAWVILGHTYAFGAISGLFGNMIDAINILDKLPFQLIMQGTYSVDSFFVLSGFLLTYLFLREMNARDGKISWLAFYLHRYWRLTPVYAIVMGFDTAVSWYLVSGPFSTGISTDNGCRKTWWWNLLYINNFAPTEDTCMGWAWYLANDMQFYVISPIFLYALWKKPKIGLGIVGVLFGASWITNFSISYYYDIFAPYLGIPQMTKMTTYIARMGVYFDKMYIKPYTRIGTYLIGVFLGFLLHHVNGRTNFLTKRDQAIGWILSTIIGLFIMLGLYNQEPDRVESAFYNAYNRCVFSLCLAWVIFACLTGHGGPVNKLLSHPALIPLSRLTYCAYLIHPIVMTVYFLSLPGSIIMTHAQMVLLFFGFLVSSYGIAFATTLLFESPTMAIEKLLRQNVTAKRKENDPRA